MSRTNRTNWGLLLDGGYGQVLTDWSTGNLSTRQVTDVLSFTTAAGEFRNLVRTYGTDYARRNARKALRYRGVNV